MIILQSLGILSRRGLFIFFKKRQIKFIVFWSCFILFFSLSCRYSAKSRYPWRLHSNYRASNNNSYLKKGVSALLGATVLGDYVVIVGQNSIL